MTSIEDRIIVKWNSASARFCNLQRFGAQEFVDPRIILKREEFGAIRILIANSESAAWYDRVDITDCSFCRSLGIVREGDIVFDCGANQGITSLIFANIVGPQGRIYAFDPFPINNKLISLNAELNGKANIVVMNKGLSKSGRRIKVSMSEQCTSEHTEVVGDEVEVELAALDEFAAFRPNCLKIDVEGAEIDCLDGARSVLSQNPAICIEMHPELIGRFGRRAEEIYEYIEIERYSCFIRHFDEVGVNRIEMPIEINKRCWLFFVPKDRPPVARL
jgi:FkbM family methyltransferase